MSNSATPLATSASRTTPAGIGTVPNVQSLARAAWIEHRTAKIMECEYFHVVFAVPDDIAAIALQNKAQVYGILVRATAETLRTIAADSQYFGAEIGFPRRPA